MKRLVCIFAHPDDESFGPSGTILLYAKEYEVHIICVTDGSSGKNDLSDSGLDLASIRKNELENSAKFMGVHQVHFLNYKDGGLCSLNYHEIAAKLQKILDELNPEILMTFDHRGVSGHLDHIAVSMITSFVFRNTASAKELMYFCQTEEQVNKFGNYFIYRPPGYKMSEINRVVDISSVRSEKDEAMKIHKSQEHDFAKLLMLYGKDMEEYFIVVQK